jgi:rare lipoprotein A
MKAGLALAAVLALGSCAHKQVVPTEPAVFTIGPAYQAGGEWRYPRNFNQYDVTGVAMTYNNDVPYTYTSDHETYDAQAYAAASPVLPLPAIVTVTNLANGRQMDVRVNDRGPTDQAGRVLMVTPAVADALGFPDDGLVEVEVKLNGPETAELDGAMGQGPKLTTAPVAGITAQSLGPPGSAAGTVENLTPVQSAGPAAANVTVSGQVTQASPDPGPLFVQIPGFGRQYDAYRMMNRLYGLQAKIVPEFDPDRTLYAVDVGPFYSVADADAALQEILNRGVTDPEIIVH